MAKKEKVGGSITCSLKVGPTPRSAIDVTSRNTVTSGLGAVWASNVDAATRPQTGEEHPDLTGLLPFCDCDLMLVGDERPMKVTVQKLFDPHVRRTQKIQNAFVSRGDDFEIAKSMGVVENKSTRNARDGL